MVSMKGFHVVFGLLAGFSPVASELSMGWLKRTSSSALRGPQRAGVRSALQAPLQGGQLGKAASTYHLIQTADAVLAEETDVTASPTCDCDWTSAYACPGKERLRDGRRLYLLRGLLPIFSTAAIYSTGTAKVASFASRSNDTQTSFDSDDSQHRAVRASSLAAAR